MVYVQYYNCWMVFHFLAACVKQTINNLYNLAFNFYFLPWFNETGWIISIYWQSSNFFLFICQLNLYLIKGPKSGQILYFYVDFFTALAPWTSLSNYPPWHILTFIVLCQTIWYDSIILYLSSLCYEHLFKPWIMRLKWDDQAIYTV